jgi:hypothetical protein
MSFSINNLKEKDFFKNHLLAVDRRSRKLEIVEKGIGTFLERFFFKLLKLENRFDEEKVAEAVSEYVAANFNSLDENSSKIAVLRNIQSLNKLTKGLDNYAAENIKIALNRVDAVDRAFTRASVYRSLSCSPNRQTMHILDELDEFYKAQGLSQATLREIAEANGKTLEILLSEVVNGALNGKTEKIENWKKYIIEECRLRAFCEQNQISRKTLEIFYNKNKHIQQNNITIADYISKLNSPENDFTKIQMQTFTKLHQFIDFYEININEFNSNVGTKNYPINYSSMDQFYVNLANSSLTRNDKLLNFVREHSFLELLQKYTLEEFLEDIKPIVQSVTPET